MWVLGGARRGYLDAAEAAPIRVRRAALGVWGAEMDRNGRGLRMMWRRFFTFEEEEREGFEDEGGMLGKGMEDIHVSM